jgi:RNA ligase
MEFDLDYLNHLVDLGYIKTQRDDSGLLLFDYTSKAQYEFAFKEHPILLNCRGLVLDENGYTVAYPLPKFFNIEEVESYGLPNIGFDVYEKLDGSLGIVYYWDGNWRVNTRGFFDSTQAIMGKDILLKKGILDDNLLNKELTYLFEIIYPDNRIVVDYGDTCDMILLTSFSRYGEEYLSELDRLKPYLNIVKRYDFEDYRSIKKLDWENSEGFVVRFTNGYRVKIKFDTYCKLHYLLTGMKENIIWEYLSGKKDINDIISIIPDEYFCIIHNIIDEFKTKYKTIEEKSKIYFIETMKEIENLSFDNPRDYRKKFVEINKKVVNNEATFFCILMAMLDKKDYSEYIWKTLKPKLNGDNTLFNRN